MTVVAVGEVLLRLGAPGRERLLQSPRLDVYVGGAEANVLAALAAEGIATRLVSALPPGALGDAALGELRRAGVDVASVRRGEGRMGLYFVEAGAGPRPTRVVYDRADSAFARLDPAELCWPQLLAGATWFHVTGITPALSERAAVMACAGARAARAAGCTVSVDFNHRAALWRWGRSPHAVMPDLLAEADIAIAGREDIPRMLGLPVEEQPGEETVDRAAFARLADAVLERFPRLTAVAITLRESLTASHNRWSALLRTRRETLHSRRWEVTEMIDRIGAGDAFTAGLLYTYLTAGRDAHQRALDFATAASCLKHTIPGDMNRVSAHEVEALLAGDGSGRVQR